MVEISMALLKLMKLSFPNIYSTTVKNENRKKRSRNTGDTTVLLNMCQILSPVKSVMPTLFIGSFPCLD